MAYSIPESLLSVEAMFKLPEKLCRMFIKTAGTLVRVIVDCGFQSRRDDGL
jgi:hypothetical protein